MKKSEMLQKLYTISDKAIESNDEKNLIDILLESCLKLGMLPPPVVYLKSPIELGVIYEWEPEGE